MKKKKESIRTVLIKEIPHHPSDIVKVVSKQFCYTRQAVFRHLQKLVQEGKVIQTGQTRAARYYLSSSRSVDFSVRLTPHLQEDQVWSERLETLTHELSENVKRTLQYAFTEMLNNAIDHSEGSSAKIQFSIEKNKVCVSIHDNGIGIFKKIQNTLQTEEPREAVLQLTKGKFTTDPSRHSGEGVFFTSRAVDLFKLKSNRLEFYRDAQDWALSSIEAKKGTEVYFEIRLDSLRTLEEVFRAFTSAESLEFNKTQVLVELGKNTNELYISRSQAKRVLLGLEKFTHIIFDFKRVKTVGQGFVDEVFRVFQNQHPGIRMESINANDDVLFMMKRTQR